MKPLNTFVILRHWPFIKNDTDNKWVGAIKRTGNDTYVNQFNQTITGTLGFLVVDWVVTKAATIC